MKEKIFLCFVAIAMLLASCSGSGNSDIDFSKITDEDKEKLSLSGYEWKEMIAVPFKEGVDIVNIELKGLQSFLEDAKDVSKLNRKGAREADIQYPFPGKIYMADYITSDGKDGLAVLIVDNNGESFGYTIENNPDMINSDQATNLLAKFAGEEQVKNLSEEERLAGILFINSVRGAVPFIQRRVVINYDGEKRIVMGVMIPSE